MKKRMMGISTIVITTAMFGAFILNDGTGSTENVGTKGLNAIKQIEAKGASIAQNISSTVTNSDIAKSIAGSISKEDKVTTASSNAVNVAVAAGPKKTTTTAPTAPVTTTQTTTQTTTTAPAVTQTSATTTTASTSGEPQINTSNLGNGTVGVKYDHPSTLKIKVQVSKGSSSYMYGLYSTSGYEFFPLQMGEGAYVVTVYKNIGGTSYATVKTFNVTLSNSSNVFLSSNQLVNWSSTTNAVVKARALASGLGSNEAKAQAIHDYLISYMHYDTAKASTIGSGYIPNISSVYSQASGICYDFASTYAAMMRSVGVPTKLVMGYSTKVSGYHAWNQVYINGTWATVDNSYDSQVKALGQTPVMIKSSSQYTGSKFY